VSLQVMRNEGQIKVAAVYSWQPLHSVRDEIVS
jgi:hypothetical protein